MIVDAIIFWQNLPGDRPLTFLHFRLSFWSCIFKSCSWLILNKKKLDIPKRQIFTRFKTFLETQLRIKIVL